MYEPATLPDGTVLVPCADKNLYAFGPDGAVRWTAPTGFALGAPARDEAGNLFLGTQDGELVALRPDGSERWRRKLSWSVHGTPALTPDGTLVVGGVRLPVQG